MSTATAPIPHSLIADSRTSSTTSLSALIRYEQLLNVQADTEVLRPLLWFIGGFDTDSTSISIAAQTVVRGSDDIGVDVPELLRSLRDASGLPVESIAAGLGVSRQTFYNWQYGEWPTPANEQRIIALARGTLDELQGRTGRAARRYLTAPDSTGSNRFAKVVARALGQRVESTAVSAFAEFSDETVEDVPLATRTPTQPLSMRRVKKAH
jgi:transcriptional regulator with XRE-family HTH domain